MTLNEIINKIGDVHYMLVHNKSDSISEWYVRGVKEIEDKYPEVTPVFHSNTIEECLGALLEELKIIRK